MTDENSGDLSLWKTCPTCGKPQAKPVDNSAGPRARAGLSFDFNYDVFKPLQGLQTSREARVGDLIGALMHRIECMDAQLQQLAETVLGHSMALLEAHVKGGIEK